MTVAGFEPTGTTTNHPVFDWLGYAWGQCAAWVAENVPWLQGGAGLGNAASWLSNAAKQGYTTVKTPLVGSIAVFGSGLPGSGGAGHVALVTGVQPGGFSVAEANVHGLDTVTNGSYATSNPNLLGFILPKGSSPTQAPGLPATLDLAIAPSNVPGSVTSPGFKEPQGGSIDLNPADWVGSIVGGVLGVLEGAVLRLVMAVLAVVFVIVGLKLIAESQGHQLTLQLPGGAATGGATKGIAEDAGEAAAA